MSPKLKPALGETPGATNLGLETLRLLLSWCLSELGGGGGVQSGESYAGLQGFFTVIQ